MLFIHHNQSIPDKKQRNKGTKGQRDKGTKGQRDKGTKGQIKIIYLCNMVQAVKISIFFKLVKMRE
jgi:hypothetical protein